MSNGDARSGVLPGSSKAAWPNDCSQWGARLSGRITSSRADFTLAIFLPNTAISFKEQSCAGFYFCTFLLQIYLLPHLLSSPQEASFGTFFTRSFGPAPDLFLRGPCLARPVRYEPHSNEIRDPSGGGPLECCRSRESLPWSSSPACLS